LNGFDINLFCDDNLQPDGKKCNSNGMWPIKMKVSIDKCDRFERKTYCAVTYEVVRGWTPTRGGLKPYNYRITFTVKIFVKIIMGTTQNFHYVQSQIIQDNTDLRNVIKRKK
jgi:hypothetical protein